MDCKLIIEFKTDKKDIHYDGSIYVKKNLSDIISVADNLICISFSRDNPAKLGDLLDSPKSIIRGELQKALCFYLGVCGEIPPVKNVTYLRGSKLHLINHEYFTETWKNCTIKHTLLKDDISLIFTNQELASKRYITLSYYLKAQIDKFSNDCFRAAWSGINSFFPAEGNESEKINGFRQFLTDSRLPLAKQFISTLPDYFWDKLDWYQYIKKNVNKMSSICSWNHIKDSLLLDKMLTLMEAYEERFTEQNIQMPDLATLKRQLKRKIEQNTMDCHTRLLFLICDYCYFLRNRNFHAGVPYPVFIISQEAETGVEKNLTELLILLMKDLIKDEVKG